MIRIERTAHVTAVTRRSAGQDASNGGAADVGPPHVGRAVGAELAAVLGARDVSLTAGAGEPVAIAASGRNGAYGEVSFFHK